MIRCLKIGHGSSGNKPKVYENETKGQNWMKLTVAERMCSPDCSVKLFICGSGKG